MLGTTVRLHAKEGRRELGRQGRKGPARSEGEELAAYCSKSAGGGRTAARPHTRGAPPIVASGRRSIEYLWMQDGSRAGAEHHDLARPGACGGCDVAGHQRLLPALAAHARQPGLPSGSHQIRRSTADGQAALPAHLWLWMNMMGTPAILRMRRRRSRSHVATM